jgi:hypothetical protein
MINICKKLKEEWIQLKEYVLGCHPPSPLVGPLLIRLVAQAKSDIQKSHGPEIIAIISEILEQSPIAVQTGLIILLASMPRKTVIERPFGRPH